MFTNLFRALLQDFSATSKEGWCCLVKSCVQQKKCILFNMNTEMYKRHTSYSSSNPLFLPSCICATCSPNFETGIGFLPSEKDNPEKDYTLLAGTMELCLPSVDGVEWTLMWTLSRNPFCLSLCGEGKVELKEQDWESIYTTVSWQSVPPYYYYYSNTSHHNYHTKCSSSSGSNYCTCWVYWSECLCFNAIQVT